MVLQNCDVGSNSFSSRVKDPSDNLGMSPSKEESNENNPAAVSAAASENKVEASESKPAIDSASIVQTPNHESGPKPSDPSSAPASAPASDAPQPPSNISGMYITCALPVGSATNTVIKCLVEKDGVKTSDPELMAAATWGFQTANNLIVTPKINPDSSGDWHVNLVFDGKIDLSPTDLENSSVELNYTLPTMFTGKLSTSYRPECKSYKPKKQVCLANDKTSIPEVQNFSGRLIQRSTGLIARYNWTFSAPAKGIMIIKAQKGGTKVDFTPTDGMQYIPGTQYGNESLFYLGSASTVDDLTIVGNTSFLLKICSFDEFYTYSKCTLSLPMTASPVQDSED